MAEHTLPDVRRRAALAEELANSITHGVGLVLSVAGLVVLVAYLATHPDASRLVSCSIFGGTLVFMYAASTLYHSLRAPRLKRLLRIVDHIAIYLLIAGTYTPFVLAYLSPGWIWTLLSLTWGLALAGTVFKLFFTGRYDAFSTLLYVAMGWLVVIALRPLLATVPAGCLLWLLAGGLLYTGGVIFYAWNRLPYNHAIWHLFVLGGSACHYIAVFRYIVP